MLGASSAGNPFKGLLWPSGGANFGASIFILGLTGVAGVVPERECRERRPWRDLWWTLQSCVLDIEKSCDKDRLLSSPRLALNCKWLLWRLCGGNNMHVCVCVC